MDKSRWFGWRPWECDIVSVQSTMTILNFRFNEFPGLTNDAHGPNWFIKSGRHCIYVDYEWSNSPQVCQN